ncbi:hypothetical protein K469DRAFT_695511 [Zopfia rhizophila CBS 207.26]|uniref:C2H2-type domain-containing protein n=1 Tax=Zopfia rhizophila CBS 207.26 TaxID=1314779 RepID=A0A6A6D9B6_9PEZI|nr:hypothetical protein K469DRAFT_682778 [Zopfia rhizophila CBS 207.26]KAF2178475.1 hypothetical protein K469DRAFT_695511 [Zopfia rhizophila CBS 207.26]
MNTQEEEADPLQGTTDDNLRSTLTTILASVKNRPHLQTEFHKLLLTNIPSQLQNAPTGIRTSTTSTQYRSSGSSAFSYSSLQPQSSRSSALSYTSLQPHSSRSSALSYTNLQSHSSRSAVLSTSLDPPSIDSTTISDRTARPSSPSPAEPRFYFCTSCREIRKQTSFGTKADWKKHESRYHDTGSDWLCDVNGCLKIFKLKNDLNKHRQECHGDSKQKPAEFARKTLFPCGFLGCGYTTTTWERRCNHVAECMQLGKLWTHTNKMRALLKQDPWIHESWKAVRNMQCTQCGISKSQLQWDPETSRTVMERLECEDVDSGCNGFFLEVFRLGLPPTWQAPTADLQSEQTSIFSVAIEPQAELQSSGHEAPIVSNPSTMTLWDYAVATTMPSFASHVDTNITLNSANNRWSVVMLDSPQVPTDVESSDGVPAQTFLNPTAPNFHNMATHGEHQFFPWDLDLIQKQTDSTRRARSHKNLRTSPPPLLSESTTISANSLPRGTSSMAVAPHSILRSNVPQPDFSWVNLAEH